MAVAHLKTVLTMALLAMLWHPSSAQTSCMPAITNLSSCMGFITGNSSAPPPSCCSSFASIVQTQTQCLCSVLNGRASQLGIMMNQTQALTLPGACSITVPPLSQCNAASGATQGAQAPTSSAIPLSPSDPTGLSPSPATSTAPAAPSDVTPATTPSNPSAPATPAGTGPKTVPATGPSSSSATSLTMWTPSILLFLFFASYAANFIGF